MTLGASDTALDRSAIPRTEIVLDVSAGLIRIDCMSNTVGLVHQTLQQYLEGNSVKLFQILTF